ncbi:polysaccharide biosynthesis tyrosine autokinase [Cellulomonas sp. zg-ZUI22]|uniref:polysaccharide biosynthesis tyrosine autokinase n=1 Tax=Cellulomonas sp. zg-ZUI22 TaxID=2816955 RepID=UPI001A9494C7|nr:polysaccharide biosynthesis tyrosine autokinase [Cellulomonas sp. zg-ZUI22]MBO0901692.1 polysaccharide biosynthesis tyrosine autokinase [Cellulomonas sp. zg-ZUI22]
MRDYVAMARAHWLGLSAFAVVGVLLAALAALLTTPQYTARAEMVVVADTGSATDLVQGSEYTQKQVRTFSALATRQVVVQPAMAELGLTGSTAAVVERLSATSVLGTNVISVTATDPSPQAAADLANAVAKHLTAAVGDIVPSLPDGSKSVRLEPITTATPPAQPTSPRVVLWILLGAIGGLALGATLITLRQLVDTKVRDEASAVSLVGAPLLGAVTVHRGRAPVPAPAGSPQAEEYRQLRTSIAALAAGGRRLVAVTSSVPGEGTTATAVNLASVLAAAGDRVCLVEANLRRPRLAGQLGLEQRDGLTSVLTGGVPLEDAVAAQGPGLPDVLTSGPLTAHPSELLATSRMRELLAELTERYDHVVLDCPPVLPVTDAVVVGRLCHGVVLVVGAGAVRRHEVRAAAATLAAGGVPVVGLVANRVPRTAWSRYGDALPAAETPAAPAAAPGGPTGAEPVDAPAGDAPDSADEAPRTLGGAVRAADVARHLERAPRPAAAPVPPDHDTPAAPPAARAPAEDDPATPGPADDATVGDGDTAPDPGTTRDRQAGGGPAGDGHTSDAPPPAAPLPHASPEQSTPREAVLRDDSSFVRG